MNWVQITALGLSITGFVLSLAAGGYACYLAGTLRRDRKR